MSKYRILLTLIVASLFSGGCVDSMIRDYAVEKNAGSLETYEQAEQTWKPITPGHGRVVVYFKKGLGSTANLFAPIELDGKKAGIMYRTFGITELPVGSHTCVQVGNALRSDKVLDFTISDQQIIYIELKSVPILGGIADAEIVPEDDARKALVHTNFTGSLFGELPY